MVAAVMTPEELQQRRRRTVVLALVHVAIAVGIMVAFMVVQSVR